MDTKDVIEFINIQLIPIVNQFRTLQVPSGKVIGDETLAIDLLEQMRQTVRKVYTVLKHPQCADAFDADLDNWLARGLDTPPAFDNSLSAYIIPEDGGMVFFAGAFTCTNGEPPVGKFMECFIAERKEPGGLDNLSEQYPNPHYFTQIGRLLAGSNGLMKGNCIVFFPENVATADPIERQDFALFFLNKSQQIYYEITLPLVQDILPDQDIITASISADDSYDALGLWSYLHEFYHQSGPRPLHANLRAKMNFFAGLLEEVKVDCQSVLKCVDDKLSYTQEVLEIVLFERLFRYPRQPDPSRNFDSGTGFFLFEWLRRNNYGITLNGTQLETDYEQIIEGFRVLVDTIMALETTPDDQRYKQIAKSFVRLILPEGANGTRFSLPESYLDWVGLQRPINVAKFESMPF